MKIRYAIIENEYFAVENLKNIVSSLRSDFELIFTSESVEESVEYFKNEPKLDLIFMDIELVDGNSFEIFSQIEILTPIIFTTAYDSYAIDAFKVNSLDYILKPVSENAVQSAIERWVKSGNRYPQTFPLKQTILPQEHRSFKKRILITKGDHYSVVPTEDIALLVSEDKYIVLVTFSGLRQITDYANLSQIEEELDPSQFYQVSRNMIVNLKSIATVVKYFNGRLLVHLKSNGKEQEKFVISNARKKQFLSWLEGNIPDKI